MFRDGHLFPAIGIPSSYAPADCRLFDNTDEYVGFLDSIRYSMKITTARRRGIFEAKRRDDPYRPAGKPRRIGKFVSFDRILQIDPAGALVLAAEFDRARRRFGARLPAVNVPNWNPEIRRTLEGLGFFTLLEIGEKPPMLSLEDQTGTWRVAPFLSDRRVSPELAGPPLQTLVSALGVEDADFFADTKLRQLFRSVVDGMANVVDHAYPPLAVVFPHVGRWWLTGAVDFENRRLTMTLYDQGITIPASLASNADKTNLSARASLQKLLRRGPTDADLVEFAVNNHVTTTGDEQRGKGLGKLLSFVDACETGELRVMSRRGVYKYTKGRAATKAELACSIGGTLISWQVGL
ncbi:hypothetical protein [Mesorhizobium sp. B2-3-4]|uniref:hypothetical protein n=1 Tax=Mesorhizobium sp. B2-3-4 TaxID=2589959 RepID=UPI00112BE5AE|nr:hypothetical protein [Mesorhizobium sp. B2-3-4]TPM31475.1 hypothetical protein FJ967_24860 [Mesorhizobium sp. B2-3-4]